MDKKKPIPNNILAIDIEATCWEKPKDQPAGEQNEIIEIGIVPISLTDLTIGEPVSILVKPKTSKISPFCNKLTTITQEMVDGGVSFREACKSLIDKFDSQNTPWISWGNYDKKQFQWQCQSMKCHYPFGSGHWNMKHMFKMMIGLEKEVGLVEATKTMGFDFEGTHHRGAHDALNIARVMVECYSRIRTVPAIHREGNTEYHYPFSLTRSE